MIKREGMFGRIVSILTVLMFVLAAPLNSEAGRNKKKPAEDQLPVAGLKLPLVISSKLHNGLRFFYINEDLPKLTLIATIGYGKLYETKNTAGMSELIAGTLLLGGSGKYPAERLHEVIERTGGRIVIEDSWENTVIKIQVLERFADVAFSVLGELIMNPNFDEQHFNDARSLLLEKIRRRRDNPERIAFSKIRELIFSSRGYGATARRNNVERITLRDLKGVWRKHARSGNIMIGIAASRDFRHYKNKIARFFAQLPRGKRIDYPVNTAAANTTVKAGTGKIYLVPRPIPQATIVVGTVAPDIHFNGVYSLRLMDYILGGGSFSSRLKREIRVKRGLSYSVQSVIRFRNKTGIFMAFAQTKNEQAPLALSLMKKNIMAMSREPVTVEELEWAKKSRINSYIFQFETPMDMLWHYLEISSYGLPASYLSSYPFRLNEVTRDDIRRNSAKLLNNGLIVLVVGSESLKDGLSKMGEVILVEP